jgi:DNA invertase Pin-like site-specific DNA recombinase
MRVVAYVRESVDPTDERTAFAQQEEIRRYASAQGLQVIAVCQDTRNPGRSLGLDGYRSLLELLDSGSADGVLLPGLATLSSDVVVQEIMLWDLRSRSAQVISTDPADLGVLGSESPDPTRLFVRDTLARVAEHAATVASPRLRLASRQDGVVVHLIPDETREDRTEDVSAG